MIYLLIAEAIFLTIIILRSVRKEKEPNSNDINEDDIDNSTLRDSFSFYVEEDGTIVRGKKNEVGKSSSDYVVQDDQEQKDALLLIQESANAGIAEAQYYLGLCYEQGSVVPKDLEMAKKWYRLAASQSFPLAKFRLGKIMMEEK